MNHENYYYKKEIPQKTFILLFVLNVRSEVPNTKIKILITHKNMNTEHQLLNK